MTGAELRTRRYVGFLTGSLYGSSPGPLDKIISRLRVAEYLGLATRVQDTFIVQERAWDYVDRGDPIKEEPKP